MEPRAKFTRFRAARNRKPTMTNDIYTGDGPFWVGAAHPNHRMRWFTDGTMMAMTSLTRFRAARNRKPTMTNDIHTGEG
jgi:hypothetical protein